MPRAVRNFWVAGDVDGRRSRITGGPRARDGGISLTLFQRNKGCVAEVLKMKCLAREDGTLSLEVEPVLPFRFTRRDGKLRIETKR
jgi:hypothetical protein